MPNKKYIKGARKERKIVNDYKKAGWDIAFRSAGSHSPVDCVAINIKEKKIRLIQSKSRKLYGKEKEPYKILEDNFPDKFLVEYELKE